MPIVNVAGEELLELRCGPELLSAITRDPRHSRWMVSATFVEANGRLECVGFHVDHAWTPAWDQDDREVKRMEPRGLTAIELRGLPFGLIARQLRQRAIERSENLVKLRSAATKMTRQLAEIQRAGRPLPNITIGGAVVAPTQVLTSALEGIARAKADVVPSIPRAARKLKYGLEDETMVAVAYTEAHLEGKPERPAAQGALSRHLGRDASLATVDYLIGRARRRGLLPSTTRGTAAA